MFWIGYAFTFNCSDVIADLGFVLSGIGCFISPHMGVTCGHNFQEGMVGEKQKGRVYREGLWIDLEVTLEMLSDDSSTDVALFTSGEPQPLSALDCFEESELLFGKGLVLGTAAALLGRKRANTSDIVYACAPFKPLLLSSGMHHHICATDLLSCHGLGSAFFLIQLGRSVVPSLLICHMCFGLATRSHSIAQT